MPKNASWNTAVKCECSDFLLINYVGSLIYRYKFEWQTKNNTITNFHRPMKQHCKSSNHRKFIFFVDAVCRYMGATKCFLHPKISYRPEHVGERISLCVSKCTA